MFMRILIVIGAVLLLAAPAFALEAGPADGVALLEKLARDGSDKSEWVDFMPNHAYAYRETVAGHRFTWLVFTSVAPPVAEWLAARDGNEARRAWCGARKTPFVAVQLDERGDVFAFHSCAADGGLVTEMPSRWNAMESVAIRFEARDNKHLKGTMKTGRGSCPADGKGGEKYCQPTGRYTFDAPILK